MNETRRAGFWATVRAVLWSFVGIRKRRDYLRDATELNPVAVVVAGVVGGVVFVLTLVVIVNVIVSQQ